MYIRKVIEVAQIHLGWRKYFICDLGVDWQFLPLLLFPWWVFWDEMWASSTKGTLKGALLRFLSLSFLPQSGAVECRRMSCPPLNCSPDSLPVHIAGQCCKVCRRKYWLRVGVVLCSWWTLIPWSTRSWYYMYDKKSFYILISCDVQILYIGFFSFLILISTLITILPILCRRNWYLKGLRLSTCLGSNNW